jgi:hypothetical protein
MTIGVLKFGQKIQEIRKDNQIQNTAERGLSLIFLLIVKRYCARAVCSFLLQKSYKCQATHPSTIAVVLFFNRSSSSPGLYFVFNFTNSTNPQAINTAAIPKTAPWL